MLLYYQFWRNLVRLLDDDEPVAALVILVPLVVKMVPEVASTCILYRNGGHLSIHDSIRATQAERRQLVWEQDRKMFAGGGAGELGRRFVRQTPTFFLPEGERGIASLGIRTNVLADAPAGLPEAGAGCYICEGGSASSDGSAGSCEALLLPCGHGGLCVRCAEIIWQDTTACHCCPICRQQVLMAVPIRAVRAEVGAFEISGRNIGDLDSAHA